MLGRNPASLSLFHCAKLLAGWCRSAREQHVVRIEMVDVGGGDHLMSDEFGRRGRSPRQDLEGQGDELVAVPLGKISDRSDEGRPWLTEFRARVEFTVLADDRARRRTAGFLERARNAKRARIVGRPDE